MPAIDTTPTWITQQPMAQRLLQRAQLTSRLLSPWSQQQLTARREALPAAPLLLMPNLAQSVAQRFARNDALATRHERHLLRFAAASQTPLPLARPALPSDAVDSDVVAATEPESIDLSQGATPAAAQTMDPHTPAPFMGGTSIAAEIAERIRQATEGPRAPQPSAKGVVTAPVSLSAGSEEASVPARVEETAEDLAQHNHSIAALIRDRIQRAETERLAPSRTPVKPVAAQTLPPVQAPPPATSVAALLRERIQRAQAERFTHPGTAPTDHSANPPTLQPTPLSFSAHRMLDESGIEDLSVEAAAEPAVSATPTTVARQSLAFLPDPNSPTAVNALPPQVRRLRAYSHVDLIATGANRPLQPVEPAAFADRTAPTYNPDEQEQPLSATAPLAATTEMFTETSPMLQRADALAATITPQPQSLSSSAAQEPAPETTTAPLAPDDIPMAELPVVPEINGVPVVDAHEEASMPLATDATTDAAGAPPKIFSVVPPVAATGSTTLPQAPHVVETTIQRQTAPDAMMAPDATATNSEEAPFISAPTQATTENPVSTALQERRPPVPEQVVTAALTSKVALPLPVNPNDDALTALPTASERPATLQAVPIRATPAPLITALVAEQGAPPTDLSWSFPTDQAPADPGAPSASASSQSTPLPRAVLVETMPLPIEPAGQHHPAYSVDSCDTVDAPPATSITATALSSAPLAVTQRMVQAPRVHRQSHPSRPASLPMSTISTTAMLLPAYRSVAALAHTLDSMNEDERNSSVMPTVADAMPLVMSVKPGATTGAAAAVITQQPPAPITTLLRRFAPADEFETAPTETESAQSQTTLPSLRSHGQHVATVDTPVQPSVGVRSVQRRINPVLAGLLPSAAPVIAIAAEAITSNMTPHTTQNRGEQPDLDSLAQQIYPLIKRMLAIERERRPFA